MPLGWELLRGSPGEKGENFIGARSGNEQPGKRPDKFLGPAVADPILSEVGYRDSDGLDGLGDYPDRFLDVF